MIIKTILRLVGNTLVHRAYGNMVIYRYMVIYTMYYYIILLFYVSNHKLKININYFISLSILFKHFKFSQYIYIYFFIGFQPKCQLLACHF